jgi:hypothetical protein
MSAKSGTWRNGKRMVTGRWWWDGAAQRFRIELNSVDRITGENRRISVAGEHPEWGKWKLDRDAPPAKWRGPISFVEYLNAGN